MQQFENSFFQHRIIFWITTIVFQNPSRMAFSCCSVESSIFSVHTRRIQIGAHNGVLRGLLFFLPFFPFSGNCHHQFMLIPFLRVRYRIVARIAMLQHGRPDDDNIVWVRSDDVVTHTHTLHNLFLSTLPFRAAPY